jgi:hypothetical protein
MSFRTQERVDVEPPSIADSLRECVTTSLRACQAGVSADIVDDIEDEVVEIFLCELSIQTGNSRCRQLPIYLMSRIILYVRTC